MYYPKLSKLKWAHARLVAALNDTRFYTHSVRETAAIAVKGSAHLYLEIVRVVLQRHSTDIRFNPKPVIRIHRTVLRSSYAFPHCVAIGVDNRA